MSKAGNIISFAGTPPTVSDIAAIARRDAKVAISPEVERKIIAARAVVERYVAADQPVYGLTTGLGAGVDTRLAVDDLIAFQMRVPLARAVGVGTALPREAVRAMMEIGRAHV